MECSGIVVCGHQFKLYFMILLKQNRFYRFESDFALKSFQNNEQVDL